MYPLRLFTILEKVDPAFRDLFYPAHLRCPLDNRIARAIEEHWPVYFPAHKECRGPSWSVSIPPDKALYKPSKKALLKLAQWKLLIRGTIAEIRSHNADNSWKRFTTICRRTPRLRSRLRDFKPLLDFLILEEGMWPKSGGVMVGLDEYLEGQVRALLAPDSPYLHSDPERLRFLRSLNSPGQKLRLIALMRSLFDRPLMILAILQKCAEVSKSSRYGVPIQNYVEAIIETPLPTTFRKTWLEHAMQVSGAVKKNGKPCPRKWAQMLLPSDGRDLNAVNAKAIEVHGWRKGKKRLSLKNIKRSGRIVFGSGESNSKHCESIQDLWLFSWMVTLWMEKHFMEIAEEFKHDDRKIRRYYRRYYHYLGIDLGKSNAKGAGGSNFRQPC